jgi:hypothetical protein
METEDSLPYSQVPVTRPYPEPTPSSPHDTVQKCYILVSVISGQLYEWFGGSRDQRARGRIKR